jgi:Flp pilus assembly protein TadD
MTRKIALAFENHRAGKVEAAAALYQEVLETDPDNGDALHGLGVLAYHRGDLHEAEELFRKSIRSCGDNALCHYHLGALLQQQRDWEGAAASFRRSLALDPRSADAHAGLGGVLYQRGERQAAEEILRRALELDPNHAHAHSSLGVALTARCLLAEAMAALDKAVALRPEDGTCRWNRAVPLLLSGNFEDGWPEFEWRLRLPGATPTQFPQPRWNGDDLAGKTLLLHAEQGLGDTIQFCRYLPEVLATGGRVLLGVQPSLKRLMGSLTGVEGSQVLTDGDALPAFDVHCPLLSLPGLFGTRLDTIPADIPYLAAEADRVEVFNNKIGNDGFKVGLVWAGNPRLKNDRSRTIPLAGFRRLAGLPDVRCFSLQKDKRPGDEQLLAAWPGVTDLAPDLQDFADTAAAIEALDLVISVDTSVAHLAGALGRPVWVLLPFAPDWRWLLHREDSPWYPTMRLFRQSEARSWPEVLAVVEEALGNVDVLP